MRARHAQGARPRAACSSRTRAPSAWSSGCRSRSPAPTPTRRARRARSPRACAEVLHVPVELYDERFTTQIAARTGGRASEDSRAAAVLLEDWLGHTAERLKRKGARLTTFYGVTHRRAPRPRNGNARRCDPDEAARSAAAADPHRASSSSPTGRATSRSGATRPSCCSACTPSRRWASRSSASSSRPTGLSSDAALWKQFLEIGETPRPARPRDGRRRPRQVSARSRWRPSSSPSSSTRASTSRCSWRTSSFELPIDLMLLRMRQQHPVVIRALRAALADEPQVWEGWRTAGTLVAFRPLAETPWMERGDAPRARPRRPPPRRSSTAHRDVRDARRSQGTDVYDLEDARAVVDRLKWATERIEELEERSRIMEDAAQQAADARVRAEAAERAALDARAEIADAVAGPPGRRRRRGRARRAGRPPRAHRARRRRGRRGRRAAARHRRRRARPRRRAGAPAQPSSPRGWRRSSSRRRHRRRRGRARPSRHAPRGARAGPRRRERRLREGARPPARPRRGGDRAARRAGAPARARRPRRRGDGGRRRPDARARAGCAPSPRGPRRPTRCARSSSACARGPRMPRRRCRPAPARARPPAPSCAPRSTASSRSPRRPRACAPRSRPVPATRG